MGWIRDLFKGHRPSEESEVLSNQFLPAELHNSSEMMSIAIELLVQMIERTGNGERRDEIEKAYETNGHIVFQLLPLKVEVFNLDLLISKMQFESQYKLPLLRCQVFAVGPYHTSSGLYGILAYSTLGDFFYNNFQPGTMVSATYDELADWERLQALARDQDLADSQDWLQQLYLDTFRLFGEMIDERHVPNRFEELSSDVSRRLSVLFDATFIKIMEKVLDLPSRDESLHDAQQVLKNSVQSLIKEYSQLENKYDALRDNPLIWLSYASQSAFFTFFQGEQMEKHVAATIGRGAILSLHVEQCQALIEVLRECVPYEQVVNFSTLANLILIATQYIDDDELSGYVLCTYSSFLLRTGTPSDYDLVLRYYKEARNRFAK